MTSVEIYLYDLSQGMAKQLSPMLLGREIDGIWHSGVVVFGREYFYGGGIQSAAPGGTMAGTPVRIINMGDTNVSQPRFVAFLRQISHRFTAETYSLLYHNCNNFANEVSIFLTGQPIPSFITGLPAEVINTPLGAMLGPVIEQSERQMRANAGGGFVPWQQPELAPVPISLPSASSSTTSRISPNRKSRPVPFPNLSLRHISAASSPLTSIDKNARKFFAQLQSHPLLSQSARELKILSDLVDQLERDQPNPTNDCVKVFNRLICNSPVDKSFALLALFRLAVSVRSVAKSFLDSEFESIFGLHRFCSEDCPTSVVLMALCSLSNLLSYGTDSYHLAIDPRTTEYMLGPLRSQQPLTRMMAAIVIYNCSLHLHFEPTDAEDHDDIGVQLISAVNEAVGVENNAAAKYRMLLALGHLVYFMGNEGILLLAALEFDASLFTEPANAAEVAADIQILLSNPI